MVGNGLRADIWEKFTARFKIPKIVEFFGATEGTSALVNVNGRTGSCGRLSPFMVKKLFISEKVNWYYFAYFGLK